MNEILGCTIVVSHNSHEHMVCITTCERLDKACSSIGITAFSQWEYAPLVESYIGSKEPLEPLLMSVKICAQDLIVCTVVKNHIEIP